MTRMHNRDKVFCYADKPFGRIVGGTCSECGTYDSHATIGSDGELHCSSCIDGADVVDAEVTLEIDAAQRRKCQKGAR